MEGAFHVWGRRDNEVSSISLYGWHPLSLCLPVTGKGPAETPQHWPPLNKVVSYSCTTPDTICFLLLAVQEKTGIISFTFFFFLSLSVSWGKVVQFTSLQTSSVPLTWVARCLFVHLRQWSLIFVEIPLFLSSQCCCDFQSQCHVRRSTSVLC